MQKQVTVRFSTEKEPIVSKVFTIEVDTDDVSSINMIDSFLSWITENNRGLFNNSGEIDCNSRIDFVGCQNKAIALGLLPKLSSVEARARSCRTIG